MRLDHSESLSLLIVRANDGGGVSRGLLHLGLGGTTGVFEFEAANMRVRGSFSLTDEAPPFAKVFTSVNGHLFRRWFAPPNHPPMGLEKRVCVMQSPSKWAIFVSSCIVWLS